MWKFTHLSLEFTPLASNFASGAYLICTLSSEDDKDSFVPTWAHLLNVGSTSVRTISTKSSYSPPSAILYRRAMWLTEGDTV